ncbi:restriction endonuclease subunit S [Vibrio harveyi]|uniref:restriction endonuclease subunit S n=1 Tax=Vibrio harveyi TaxID=669 RepID=UPI00403FF94A
MSASEQQVPEGFKLTEVGIIPLSWNVVSFGDIVKYIKGYPFKSSEYTDSGIRVVRVSDTSYSSIKNENPIFVSQNSKDKYKKWALKKGDLIFTTVGSKPPMYDSLVGRALLVEDKHQGFLLNQNAVLITPLLEADNISHLLLNHFRTERYIEHIEQIYRGNANQASITLDGLFEFKIPLPKDPREQTAIANALSDTDALVTELEKLIAKKQAIKTATMQQLLTGKKRLPEFALHTEGEKKGQPKGMKSSELGDIPEDWKVICFDDLKDKKDSWAITGGPFGSNLKASDYTDSGVRVIQLQNIGDGVFKNNDFVFTHQKKADELRSCNIYPNEIILSKMGDPVARACIVPEYDARYLMCSDGIRLKVAPALFDAKFIFYSLNYKTFRNQALDASTGSTRKRIGLSELRRLKLVTPQKSEQTAIGDVLSSLDAEINALDQRLEKTRQIKKGMMQELLTGRTRLPFKKD